MRHTATLTAALLLTLAVPAFAAEFHVAPTGDNTADGSADHPLKTIQAAARKAQAGDTITVHAGTYRERVDPPRGGSDDAHRIVYQAAQGETVVITGSERITGWTKVGNDTWKAEIPNSLFGAFNPFGDLIGGDWFNAQGRQSHTGAVYLGDQRLSEAAALAQVTRPVQGRSLFFAQLGKETTVVHAQFPGQDPNQAQVEVNVRQTVFYPSKNFINYITVRGFTLQNAAPNWAPPTVEQKAVIGPNWAKGWIIENNLIQRSACAGLSLGKYGDPVRDTDGSGYKDWNTTIDRARANGWNKEKVGSHLVRGNEIRDCDEVGIVGAFGCAYSIVERNHIHDIAVRRLFGGAEFGGIKFHGAVDTLIRDNWIHHCTLGMHLDWMTQGTQITGNLFHDNSGRPSGAKVGFYELGGGGQDIFLEVNHGPCVIANNILLSSESIFNASHGTLFAHNLMRGVAPCLPRWTPRKTPHLAAHGTATVDQYDTRGGDDRYFNNLFLHPASLRYYGPKIPLPVMMEGNVFTKGSAASPLEKEPLLLPDAEPKPALEIRDGAAYLRLATDPAWGAAKKRRLVEGGLLGKTAAGGNAFENPDGSPIKVDTDYFGKQRDAGNPFPGPFETPVNGEVKVWPK